MAPLSRRLGRPLTAARACGYLSVTKPKQGSESKEYLQGKFRFRMIASNFAIVGAGIQGDVLKDETIWSDLQKVIKVFAIEGTQFLEIVLPDQFD